MDNNGRTHIMNTIVSVHSPHDGGYYAEEARLIRGKIHCRVTKQTWPTHKDCERAVLNKKARWGKFE